MVSAPSLDPLFVAFQSALAGRYSLERELGRGGMGVVYLAREVRLDRLVAIKVLPPSLAAHAPLRERFLREARMAARLSQPNIIPIYAVDEAQDFVFYVMAYVNGETLAHRIATRGPLPAPEAARILREVAWALAYAHAQGVVHRDVKPENILLEQGTGRALVADFGIARLAQASGGTGVGEVLGTPDFMSPEQASGEAVDGRSDLYSLGVVGYYVLSGKLPFEGPNAAAIMAKHLTVAAPPTTTVAPAVPRALAQAMDRCLAKNPAERFASGEALAEALGDALEVRRETPVPVRVFLKRIKVVGIMGTYVYMVVLPTFISRLLWMLGRGGQRPVIELGIFMALLALPPLFTWRQLRRLARVGYGADDVALALKLAFERRREEMQFEYSQEPLVRDRVLSGMSVFCFGVAAVSGIASRLLHTPYNLSGMAVASAFFGVILGGVALFRRNVRLGRLPLWGRFWGGPVGRRLFRVASMGLRIAAPAANRPTELALGSVAEALFHALPRETRRALGDLPEVIKGLEARAQQMRQRIEDLDRTIAEAGPVARAPSGHRDALVADLGVAREAAQTRLGEVVAALETIRLDLLRLRAGAGTVESVTADLTNAREIGEQTERLLAAQREVEEALHRG